MIKGKAVRFCADHTKLKPGIYVAQEYYFIDPESTITTLDLRFVKPNLGGWRATNVIGPKALHTIQHIGNMFLRNHPEYGDRVIDFLPMGSRTGFYLILAGSYTPGLNNEVHRLIIDMCNFILDSGDDIPEVTPKECSNWYEHDLSKAKYPTRRYLQALLEEPCFDYPIPKPEEV